MKTLNIIEAASADRAAYTHEMACSFVKSIAALFTKPAVSGMNHTAPRPAV